MLSRLPTLKEKTCAQCGTQFRPFSSTSRVCSPICASKWVRASNRLEREQFKARKEAVATIKQLIAKTQTAFNAYIRARDAGKNCICCGQPFEPMKPGGSVDAGHWRSRGAAPQLRFDEANVHAQRKNCNRPGGAKAGPFRAGMIERVGIAEVERLEADNTVRKWTRTELIAIRAQYVEKLKELKRSRG
jgi:hypothetical protein